MFLLHLHKNLCLALLTHQ